MVFFKFWPKIAKMPIVQAEILKMSKKLCIARGKCMKFVKIKKNHVFFTFLANFGSKMVSKGHFEPFKISENPIFPRPYPTVSGEKIFNFAQN